MFRLKMNLKLWAGVALLTAMTTTSAWAIDLSGSEWDFAQLAQTTCFGATGNEWRDAGQRRLDRHRRQ
ncbi:MAG: hypothetical protein R3E79_61435 [Caldilineaceae bacterium]